MEGACPSDGPTRRRDPDVVFPGPACCPARPYELTYFKFRHHAALLQAMAGRLYVLGPGTPLRLVRMSTRFPAWNWPPSDSPEAGRSYSPGAGVLLPCLSAMCTNVRVELTLGRQVAE